MLEQYTAANPGRHLVIFGQWGDKLADGRWLAAPLITHRISNGLLAFTPDIRVRKPTGSCSASTMFPQKSTREMFK